MTEKKRERGISEDDLTVQEKGLGGGIPKVTDMDSKPTVQRVLVKRLNDIILCTVSEMPQRVWTARGVHKLCFVLTVHAERTSTCEGRIQNDPETDGVVSTGLTHPLSRLHDTHFVVREICSIHCEGLHLACSTAGKGDIPTTHPE